MPIFHYLAYQAACYDQLPKQYKKVDKECFLTVPDLERALGWLNSEQLCDAFYGDWVLQLDSVAGPAQLQVRSFLIGGGALAANYLAELAQNADDATDTGDAELRLCLAGDWLLVANNGRKVTPGNLRGLCRFFVHRGGKQHELNDETIGKFGIGFKSSYRIASEVRVLSWDHATGELAFRLPISKADVPNSLPDAVRQSRVVDRLRHVGAEFGEDGLTADRLGYCTPEFLADGIGLPTEVAKAADGLRDPARGTLFAFHLHPEGAAQVRERIAGQEAEGLYEFCPLFLPKLRRITLGGREMRMSLGNLNEADGLPGKVEARKVTLRTMADSRTTRDCFWRLRGLSAGDHWQLALHADTDHRLRTERDTEAARTLREGGAYAFFPLNDANRDFSLRLHLHLDLPTNLSRSNWNPAETPNVRLQIGRAVAGLSEWLEAHQGKQHADWCLEKLFREQPPTTAEWSHEIYSGLHAALKERRLLRTLWGGWQRAPEALAVRLSPASTVRTAWRELCKEVADIGGKFPFVELSGQVDFGVPDATADHLREFFARAAEHVAPSANFWKNMLHSVLGAEAFTPKHIEVALGRIPVERMHGAPITVATAMQQPAGVELTKAWHAAFVTAANWLRDDPRRTMSVFGETLTAKVNRLSEPRFSVGWDEVATRMAGAAPWTQHGDQFWSTPRTGPCPAALYDEVLAALRVKDGTGNWHRLMEIWLLDASSVTCFHGVVRPWNRGTALNNNAQTGVREKLATWGLLSAYEKAVAKRLETGLADRLQERFATNPVSPLDLLLEPGHRNGRQNLEHGWTHLVQAAEKKALKGFLDQQRSALLGVKTFLNTREEQFPFAVRRVLTLILPGFAESPRWLHAKTWALLQEHGLTQGTGFEWLAELTAGRRKECAEEMLRIFYRWRDTPLEPANLAALDTLFVDVRGTWNVGLASNRPKRLNELRTPAAKKEDDDAARDFECTITHAGTAVWHLEPLPEPLASVPNVARHGINADGLRLEPLGNGLIVPTERVHPDVVALPEVAERLRAQTRRVEYLRPPLNLRWTSGGNPVCEVMGAAFAFDGDRFLVSRLAVAPDDHQYQRILTTYELVAPEDRSFHAARGEGRPTDALYRDFRPAILRVLREKLVTEEGYEARHILRELLQNAESAYASQGGELPATRPFYVWSEPVGTTAGTGGKVRVSVTHCGRAFNEPDCDGKARADDIARIVSLRATQQNTVEEIGRFNRGFKSVFSVADRVQVRSGEYDFEIEDLLLLHPPEPAPNASRSPETRFSFECPKLKADKLFGSERAQTLTIFHPGSFVFLKFVDEVKLEHGVEHQQWTLARNTEKDADEEETGWSEVVVTGAGSEAVQERFLIFAGRTTGQRRFGVAVRLDPAGVPRPIEPAWNHLHLTFPTETAGPCGMLLNGDFNTDGGRIDVRQNDVNGAILKAAFRAVHERLRQRLRDGADTMTRAEWLGWARVLQLRQTINWVQATFPTDPLNIRRDVLREIGSVLVRRVPHGDGLVPLANLVRPSQLMREIAATDFGVEWEVDDTHWIHPEVESQVDDVDKETGERFTLRDFARECLSDLETARRVLTDLLSPLFTRSVRLDAIGQNELGFAVALLQAATTASNPTVAPAVQLPLPLERIEIEDVLEWWEDNEEPDDYLLEGTLWPFFGDAALDPQQRVEALKTRLASPTSPEGRRLWYQVLGFACLLGAGRRVVTIRQFWQEKLIPADFWSKTERSFIDADQIFEEVIHAEFRNASAAGEDAVFWRRVFYDVRKARHLVYENDFAEVILELASDPNGAGRLLAFLKTGALPGQGNWRGVLGQSAGSALFFVVRELRRLGLIVHAEADATAFFVCTPVRRLAVRLDWIKPELAARHDFESLQEASFQIHAKVTNLPEPQAAAFQRWHDVPLLHYQLHHA